MEARSPQPAVKNPKRRMMLTLGVTGVVALVLGKVFGDAGERFLQQSGFGTVKETKFRNFTLTESEAQIVLSDRQGDEIFIVEKETN